MWVFFLAIFGALLLGGAAGLSAPTTPHKACFQRRPGRDVTVKLCGNCHAAETVASVRHTPEGWREVIARMVTAGAKGTEQELETVFQYRVDPIPSPGSKGTESEHRKSSRARECGRSSAQGSGGAHRAPREARPMQEARGPQEGRGPRLQRSKRGRSASPACRAETFCTAATTPGPRDSLPDVRPFLLEAP